MRPPSITTSYGEPAGTGAKAPGPAFGPHARTTHAISATRVIEVLLPGTVFTHVRNHASEPVGGIAPVGLNRALRRIRVSRFDGPDNDVVLGNRRRDLIHQRIDVDAHVALGLRLDAVMEGQQTGPAGAETPSHDQLPQPPVRGGDPVVTGGGFLRFRHRPPFIPPRRDTRKAIFVSLAGSLPRRYNDLPTMKTGTMTLRNLDRWRDFEACVELQRDTWGRDFSACVPAAVLMVAQRVGGVTAGAFDAEGRLQGFIFGLTGYSGGRPMHWSHMLAVRERARDAGLGIRLKLY